MMNWLQLLLESKIALRMKVSVQPTETRIFMINTEYVFFFGHNVLLLNVVTSVTSNYGLSTCQVSVNQGYFHIS